MTAEPDGWRRERGVDVRRSARFTVIRVNGAPPPGGHIVSLAAGGLAALGYGAALVAGSSVAGSANGGADISVIYLCACVPAWVVWTWLRERASRSTGRDEVLRIGEGRVEAEDWSYPLPAVTDVRVAALDGAASCRGSGFEFDCRSRTPPLRAQRRFAVFLTHGSRPVALVEGVSQSQADFIAAELSRVAGSVQSDAAGPAARELAGAAAASQGTIG